jgi:RNA polymerase sigma-70 factor (ECF subfamily)
MTALSSHPIDGLIGNCIAGDRAAQRILFHKYKNIIMHIVCRFLGPRSKIDVEDVIQQSYIAVFRGLPQFKGEAAFETWLYRICTMTCMQHIRKKYRKRTISVIDGDLQTEHIIDNTYDPGKSLEQKELSRMIYCALDSLRPERRIAFILAEIDGRSLDEIASIVNCALGTVKSRLFRARKDMIKRLGPIFAES